MPAANRLSWNISNAMARSTAAPVTIAKAVGDGGSDSKSDFNVTVGSFERCKDTLFDLLKEPGTWAAAADGAIAGELLAHTALSIDPHVLSAIQFSTVQELHGLPGIDDYIHDHFFSVPLQSADGWFERLTGYVAEQKAASALEQMGHHVVFAPVSNQPIWDLMVDGHPVQIKESLAGVKEFVLQHPGVTVFTDPDIAAAVKHNAVHGLAVLDKDAIHAGTQNALDGVHGAITPHIHIPFITMAFSSWREAKLLWNEKTTFERAIAHVGLDVIGVGGGALAGAKSGALAGGLIGGPVGAAVGGFFGAILGGVGGKMLSTGIRFAPFNAAKEAYNEAIANAQSSVNGEINKSERRVAELRQEYQQKFLQERYAIETEAKNKISGLSQAFEAELLGFCGRFPVFLKELKRQLERERQEVLLRTPGSGFLRYIFPSEADLYRGMVNRWFRRATKLIDDELQRFVKIEVRTVAILYTEIQRFLKEYRFELRNMAEELTRLDTNLATAQGQADTIREKAKEATESVRSGLIREFGKQTEKMHAAIVSEITRWNVTIQFKRDTLKREGLPVGINL
jgi:hypothetical protein